MEKWKIIEFYGKHREFIDSVEPYPLVAQSIRREGEEPAFRDPRTRKVLIHRKNRIKENKSEEMSFKMTKTLEPIVHM